MGKTQQVRLTAHSLVNKFVQEVRQSKKYRAICEDTVRDVILVEIMHYGEFKKASKPAKERLHKIWAEYLGTPKYDLFVERLVLATKEKNDEAIRKECIKILESHLSTKERIRLMENGYYAAIFDVTGTPTTIADLACALNPFAFRWMSLSKTVQYHAYDINKNFVDFIQAYFALEGLQPLVFWQDIYVNTPDMHFDIAFVFKMYHCLEHRRKGAGLELLKKIKADWIAVSFPSQNLVGKKADIYGNYATNIENTCLEMNWELHRIDYSNEVLILIKKEK